jgi:hypothetical protein
MTKPKAKAGSQKPKKADKPKVGRPSAYNLKLAETICERLVRGEPLARICDDEGMPAYSTVRRWEMENPEFQALSARAKADGTHFLADDCLRIADEKGPDPADKRIRIDTRLRLIGKWNAKQYGEKVQQEVSGPDGGPVPVTIFKLPDNDRG